MGITLTWKRANDFFHTTCSQQRGQAGIAITGTVVGDGEAEVEVVLQQVPHLPASLAEVVPVEYDDTRLHAAP